MQFIDRLKSYRDEHKKMIKIGGLVCVAMVLAIIAVMIFLSYRSHHAYQAIKSCDILPPSSAMDLLGDKIINHEANDPTIKGNLGVSKCSYSDENVDEAQMKVVALAIQSSINDLGTKELHRTFAISKKQDGNISVDNVGDDAFFNSKLGQLNVLKNRSWLILSYGIGSSPQTNSQSESVKLANNLLKKIPAQ